MQIQDPSPRSVGCSCNSQGWFSFLCVPTPSLELSPSSILASCKAISSLTVGLRPEALSLEVFFILSPSSGQKDLGLVEERFQGWRQRRLRQNRFVSAKGREGKAKAHSPDGRVGRLKREHRPGGPKTASFYWVCGQGQVSVSLASRHWLSSTPPTGQGPKVLVFDGKPGLSFFMGCRG
jgi:hypothetical protein